MSDQREEPQEKDVLKRQIDGLRARLEPLEGHYRELVDREEGVKLDAYVGRCFQTDMVDNDTSRSFFKVLGRESPERVVVLSLEIPMAEDIKSGSGPFYSIELVYWSFHQLGFDKEITPGSFDKHLQAILQFLEAALARKKAGKKEE